MVEWTIKEQLIYADDHERIYRAGRENPLAVVAIADNKLDDPEFYVMTAELFDELTKPVVRQRHKQVAE